MTLKAEARREVDTAWALIWVETNWFRASGLRLFRDFHSGILGGTSDSCMVGFS